jgi:hypothetical protein
MTASSQARSLFVVALLASAFAPAAALAEGPDDGPRASVGFLAHDVSDPNGAKESGTLDLQGELDSSHLHELRVIGVPRLNFVLSLNTANRTSYAAAGLTWDRRLWRRFEGKVDFGIAYTDGEATAPPGIPADQDRRLVLGSQWLFREAVELTWRIKGPWRVGGRFEHLSNGGVLGNANHNEGINNAGLILSYRFR